MNLLIFQGYCILSLKIFFMFFDKFHMERMTQKVHIWTKQHPEIGSDLFFHIQLLERQSIYHGAFWPRAQSTQNNEGFTAAFSSLPSPHFSSSLSTHTLHEWPPHFFPPSPCSAPAKDVINSLTVGFQRTVKSNTKVAHW